jgi:glycosyltransferase involved in cell wall biosynthesis
MNFQEFKEKFEKVKVVEFDNQVTHKPLVSIFVQTYQQVNYIEECLISLLNQRTNFEFEILLGDDYSTDGTREICIKYAQHYPSKIKLFLHHRENNILINNLPTGRFNYLFNLYSARGKYIALCEGDDYWPDNFKLQKQLDLLINNKEANYCVGIAQVKIGNELKNIFIGKKQNQKLIKNYSSFKVNTLLIETALLREIEILYKDKIRINEFTLNYILFEHGIGLNYNCILSVYRITGLGSWSSLSFNNKMQAHYRDVKSMRKYLLNNWSFFALQEIVTYIFLFFKIVGIKSKIKFLSQNSKDFLIVTTLFFLKFGYITSIPNFIRWINERRNTGFGI